MAKNPEARRRATAPKVFGRPPAAGNSKTTIYRVAAGFVVCDNSGTKRYGGRTHGEGDRIELTGAQAKHFQKMGAITMDIPDDESELDDDVAADTAGDANNSSEAGDEPETDGQGKPAAGDADGQASTQKAAASKRKL